MNRNILQIGYGNFGRNHIRAWLEMGGRERFWIAELNESKHAEIADLGVPKDRITARFEDFLDRVDAVDIVTPSDSHFDLCLKAIRAGKDVFVEKPMVMTSAQAERLAEQVESTGKILQVGYYYRYHPLSIYAKKLIDQGALGSLRHLSGSFMGFKRARNDVGVTHTDGIHFLDLFNWFLGGEPEETHAMVKDHFGRGLEDFSVVLLYYPKGVTAELQSGYIQPGRWRDKVVANAFTTKEIFICGDKATLELDFETEKAVLHHVRHELRSGVWTAVVEGSESPNAGTANTIEMVKAELSEFISCVESRRRPGANVRDAGTRLAYLMEAVYDSSRQRRPARLQKLVAA